MVVRTEVEFVEFVTEKWGTETCRHRMTSETLFFVSSLFLFIPADHTECTLNAIFVSRSGQRDHWCARP